jgi:hypothetical protein
MINTKMDLVEIGWGCVDWIGLAQDRYKWKGLVNAVMNLRVLKMVGNSRVATQLVASRAVLSSVELVICQHQRHIRTDGRTVCRSVSTSWSRAPSGARDQMFVTDSCGPALVGCRL